MIEIMDFGLTLAWGGVLAFISVLLVILCVNYVYHQYFRSTL